MGYYINPPTMTKEQWLAQEAVVLPSRPTSIDPNSDKAVVCLVDNIMFSAAGIVVDDHELKAFSDPYDLRPKAWFEVDKQKAAANCPEYANYLARGF